MTLSDETRVEAGVTLRNGVWIHETEWLAIQALVRAVHDILPKLRMTRSRNLDLADIQELVDAYWSFRNSEMDVEDETRAIRSLTQIVGELSAETDDVTIGSVL